MIRHGEYGLSNVDCKKHVTRPVIMKYQKL